MVVTESDHTPKVEKRHVDASITLLPFQIQVSQFDLLKGKNDILFQKRLALI